MRTLRVIRTALAADRQNRLKQPSRLNPDFLPASLEVVETPVSPTGRITAWVMVLGLVATLLWLVLGHTDVVASAVGKIKPSGSVKIVQSPGTGIVRAFHVQDGDHVSKGQLLIELDTTLSTAELQEAQKGLLAAELDVARGHAIVDALSGKGVHFNAPAGTSPEVAETQQRLVAAQVGEVEATVESLAAARSSALSDAAAANATQRKLGETIPILDHELEAMQRLDAKGYAPGMRLMELERQVRGENGDREVALAQRARGVADASKLAQQMSETREQGRRIALTDLAKAESDAILKNQEVVKASRRAGLQSLYAPVDGTVQQLAIHTVGGVVEPAKALMVIVPDSSDLEVDAQVLNKDAGFVHSGQPVKVKIDAFPFTRYGTVDGRVVSVSRDAVPDPKLGPTFTATIRMDRRSIIVDGRPVPLSSGLSVVADIRTGSRRIISWLLSPIQTTVSQAGRER